MLTHYFELFWGLRLLWGYLASSGAKSCSATPISYKGDEISRESHIVFEIPILGYSGFGATFGVFVVFLLGDPDFL